MKKAAFIFAAAVLSMPLASAQKKFKPWTEWSEKDAQKILDDSPWGQTQVETNTSEMVFTPGSTSARDQEGAYNQATNLNLRIRFLSAKPIRQAFARLIESKADSQVKESLRDFVERKFDEWIVVSVTYDSRDGRLSGPVMQSLHGANAGLLKNVTYLERKDGKRQFLEDYKAPGNDGLGAKFIFKRIVDGQPFIDARTGEVRFYCELPRSTKSTKVNMRFKIADMIYDGQLEY